MSTPKPVPYTPNDDGCWIYDGCLSTNGYGHMYRAGKAVRAHRASWEDANGDIPDGMCVCHRCDVPACVNPSHLFLGTKADNNADARRKKRHVASPGEKNGFSKLTEEQVRAIRADERILREVAADYGVSIATIWRIRTRTYWRNVN